LLKGQTSGVTNAHFMCGLLQKRGVQVKRVSIVSDDVSDIAEEVVRFSQRYDYVFTSGGVGATHDDRTYEALAAAFGEPLEVHGELKGIVEHFLAMWETNCANVEEIVERLSCVPISATLIGGEEEGSAVTVGAMPTYFPVTRVHNVVAFPGIPTYCEQAFCRVEKSLFRDVKPLFVKTIYLRESEVHLQAELNRVVRDHRQVSIGCYPAVESDLLYKTQLNVESESRGMGEAAVGEIVRVFKECIASYDEPPTSSASLPTPPK